MSPPKDESLELEIINECNDNTFLSVTELADAIECFDKRLSAFEATQTDFEFY